MTKIKYTQFIDSGGLLPLDETRPDDIFIVCASFEDRTKSIVTSFTEDYRAKYGIIYYNTEFLGGVSKGLLDSNLKELESNLFPHCESMITIKGSWLDAKIQIESIKNGLSNLELSPEERISIVVDSTTFNREALLSLLLILRSWYPNSETRIIYTSPNIHGDWLSRGFRLMRNVSGFPGIQAANKASLLIVLSGFEPERAMKIIDEYEASVVLLGIGDPPTHKNFNQRNLNEQQVILARQEVREFKFPADSIINCQKSLTKEVKPLLDKYNITIAPMSTKLSTIAVFLLAEQYPEIQLTYCLPGEYNVSNYSSGNNTVFLETLPPPSNIPMV